MSGLAGYTLLLAAVAGLLIRAGQLWEDIRTILLLIVLIFLAISMSFDEVLSADLATGRWYFLGGLAFSVVLSELVLRGVRLRLPILFRLPYYAMLAMFFLYPLLLGPWQDQENDPHIRWLLAGFSPLAGLLTLTLLPAIRRGANYVRDNGSPWQWPWYPWPLFAVLGVGVGLRSYALCVSFHPSRGPATMFEPYFLVPFLFAVNILLLEIGIISRRPLLLRWMMAAPLGLLLLSTWTFTAIPESINLRRMLLDAWGCSPLFLMLVAITALYAAALVRRLPHSLHWLTIATAMFVVVGPSTGEFPWALHVAGVAFGAVDRGAVVCDDPLSKRVTRPADRGFRHRRPVHHLAASDRYPLVRGDSRPYALVRHAADRGGASRPRGAVPATDGRSGNRDRVRFRLVRRGRTMVDCPIGSVDDLPRFHVGACLGL